MNTGDTLPFSSQMWHANMSHPIPPSSTDITQSIHANTTYLT
jgi:hypothetical protein